MLEKFGFVKLTHPQKSMPIFIDVLKIVAWHPYVFHETTSYDSEGKEVLDQAEAERLFEAGELETKNNFHFVMTTVVLEDKTEVNVKERPALVAKRVAAIMSEQD